MIEEPEDEIEDIDANQDKSTCTETEYINLNK